MIHFYGLRSLALALAGLAVLSLAEPVGAKEGSLWGHIEFSITNPPGYPGPFAIRENQGSYSKVQPLGQVGGLVTIDIDTIIDGVQYRSGNIFLKNANGDTLSLSYAVAGPVVTGPISPTNFTTLIGTFSVSGGTIKGKPVTGGGGDIIQHVIPSNATDLDGRFSY